MRHTITLTKATKEFKCNHGTCPEPAIQPGDFYILEVNTYHLLDPNKKVYRAVSRWHGGCHYLMLMQTYGKRKKVKKDHVYDKARHSLMNRRNYVIRLILKETDEDQITALSAELQELDKALNLEKNKAGRRTAKARELLAQKVRL